MPFPRSLVCILVLGGAAGAWAAAAARPDGNPDFAFACPVRHGSAAVSTEGGRLVLRLDLPGRRRLRRTIVGDPERRNALYRYRLVGGTGATQQLRFLDGARSYVLYTLFRAPNYAGRGFVDEAGFLVLEGSRIVGRYRCRSGGGFDEDHRLDRLPEDPLEVPLPWPR